MVHKIRQTQLLPISIDRAWDYFSNPVNLNEITPKDMKFRILSDLPQKVYPGLIILYKVNIFRGITVDWATEITQVQEKNYFVDEQRFGPYSMWHHEHHFKEVPQGVEMVDVIHYKLPFGKFGNLFHGLLVKPKLDRIFKFRQLALDNKYPR